MHQDAFSNYLSCVGFLDDIKVCNERQNKVLSLVWSLFIDKSGCFEGCQALFGVVAKSWLRLPNLCTWSAWSIICATYVQSIGAQLLKVCLWVCHTKSRYSFTWNMTAWQLSSRNQEAATAALEMIASSDASSACQCRDTQAYKQPIVTARTNSPSSTNLMTENVGGQEFKRWRVFCNLAQSGHCTCFGSDSGGKSEFSACRYYLAGFSCKPKNVTVTLCRETWQQLLCPQTGQCHAKLPNSIVHCWSYIIRLQISHLDFQAMSIDNWHGRLKANPWKKSSIAFHFRFHFHLWLVWFNQKLPPKTILGIVGKVGYNFKSGL